MSKLTAVKRLICARNTAVFLIDLVIISLEFDFGTKVSCACYWVKTELLNENERLSHLCYMNINLHSKRSRTIVLLYVLLAYVLFQFGWWAYLIYSLHETILIDGPAYQVDEEIGKQLLQSKLMMIIGEAAVFITLLLVGFGMIRRSFKKEVALVNQQRNFLLSVTHELKTPLAGVKLNLQTLAKRQLSQEQINRIVEMSEGEIDRLADLVDNILTVTRMDSESFVVQEDEVTLRSIIEEAIGNQAHEIILNMDEAIVIKSDANALHMVMSNLLSNAVKYGGEGPITVDVNIGQEAVYLDVSDSGVGVAKEEREKVFEKFYRVGNESTRLSKGTGLGLYIVRDLMRSLGGKVYFTDPKLGGATVRVVLKKN